LSKTPFWRINQQITAPEVRVIGPDGSRMGVITRAQAISEARKLGLDLVEIAPKGSPPVVKIVNFGKFRYAEERKLKEQKKKAKNAELKEVRFSPFIAEGDYRTRFRRVSRFLNEGSKVKLVIVFKGRQMGGKKFGYSLLEDILSELGEAVSVDMQPKFLGRHLAMVVSPLKKKRKNAETKNQKERS